MRSAWSFRSIVLVNLPLVASRWCGLWFLQRLSDGDTFCSDIFILILQTTNYCADNGQNSGSSPFFNLWKCFLLCKRPWRVLALSQPVRPADLRQIVDTFSWHALQQSGSSASVRCCLYLAGSALPQLLGHLLMRSKFLLPALPGHACTESK